MKMIAFKATIIALSTLFSFNAYAENNPTLGKEYVEIKQAPSAQKEVISFFSFYCNHCYNFEMTYKIPDKIAEKLPQGATLKEYHVNFLGAQSENLTRAWALAMALGAENKVKVPLFERAKNNSLRSMDDIRQVFIDNGINAEQFDGGINSFAVNGLVNKQTQLAKELKVSGVPAYFVNEQYQVNSGGFSDSKSVSDFVQRYVDTIIFLISKESKGS